MPTFKNKGTRKAPPGAAKQFRRRQRNRRVYKRKGASAQANQIVKLNKRVDSILDDKRHPRVGLYHGVYNDSLTDTIISIVPALTATALDTMGAWARWGPNVSATDTQINAVTRARIPRIYNRLVITCGTEYSPVSFSVFHVRLQPKMAQSIVTQCGQNLRNGSMTEANGYFKRGTTANHGLASTYGNVVLNPDFFITKKSWKFTLTPSLAYKEYATGTSVQGTNPATTMKTLDWSFPCNYTMGSPQNNWKSTTAVLVDPEYRNYLLIFSDNGSSTEGSPSFRLMSTTIAQGLQGINVA